MIGRGFDTHVLSSCRVLYATPGTVAEKPTHIVDEHEYFLPVEPWRDIGSSLNGIKVHFNEDDDGGKITFDLREPSFKPFEDLISGSFAFAAVWQSGSEDMKLLEKVSWAKCYVHYEEVRSAFDNRTKSKEAGNLTLPVTIYTSNIKGRAKCHQNSSRRNTPVMWSGIHSRRR